MPATNHTMTAACPFANSDDGIEVKITFTHLRGSPARGPSYSSGGQPADPDEIELVSVAPLDPALVLPSNLKKAIEDWAEEWLTSGDSHAAIYEAVASDDEAAHEAAAEMRADR